MKSILIFACVAVVVMYMTDCSTRKERSAARVNCEQVCLPNTLHRVEWGQQGFKCLCDTTEIVKEPREH